MELIVRRWQLGWGLCRGLAPATETPDGLLAPLGLPGRAYELIALRADDDPESVRRLAKLAATAADPTWLMVPTADPATAESALRDAGLELSPNREWLMSADLAAHPTRTPPQPYRATTTMAGGVATTQVTLPSGDVAASGRGAIVGTDLVLHDIRTVPEHRRRGLGGVVVSALCQHALERGAMTALLVATPEGERLYDSLGWTTLATAVSGKPSGG
jgi:GNAT superfamily N-acetyltransferase